MLVYSEYEACKQVQVVGEEKGCKLVILTASPASGHTWKSS